VSDEPKSDGHTPDPLRDLLDDSRSDATNSESSAPIVPSAQQFSSRREARNAAAPGRRPANRASGAPSAPRKTKLSRRDQAAVRKLAATPVIAPVVAAAPPRKQQHPIKAIFAVLVVAGIVGGLALPAAAGVTSFSNATGIATSFKHSQSVKVSANIEMSKVSRDAVSATSEAELRTEQINARELADNPGVRQPGDDYPWRLAGYSLSPLGYYYRQCVDFVAWRLNRDQGVTSAPWKWVWSNLTPWGGDASQWKSAWQRHGWTVSTTPVVGSVAWFVGDHVAYVHSISGSNVTIEEYNGEASRAYAMRTIPISSVADFLYPPH
jgi:surface antigen